jgi:anti-sigma B factor antagonist
VPIIDVKPDGDVAVLDLLAKRLDASVAGTFKAAVLEVIKAGKNRLVLDMSSVGFVDSSGLGALVSILKSLGPQGSLAVVGVQPGVLTLFRLTRMDKVFRILPTVPEGIATLAG